MEVSGSLYRAAVALKCAITASAVCVSRSLFYILWKFLCHQPFLESLSFLLFCVIKQFPSMPSSKAIDFPQPPAADAYDQICL